MKDEIDLAKLVRYLRYEEGQGPERQIRLLLFVNSWSIGMTLDRNKGLVLTEFGRN